MIYRLAARLFAGESVGERVATRVHFDTGPEAVWKRLLFYEEVPGRPPPLLRTFLPCPLRTEGSKTCVGERVRCIYPGGDLVKRISAVEPGRLLQFEVVEQRLGIEGCVRTQSGAYDCSPCGDGTDVTLVTKYRAYLRPRCLWRGLETLLVRQLHRHILGAARAAPVSGGSPAPAVLSLSRQLRRHPAGDPACTTLQSCSHR